MDKRLELQVLFEKLLESRNVYFQPPESMRIEYDAIVYALGDIENLYANNQVYKQNTRYEVTLIVKDPDAEIIRTISKLPKCTFDRHFTKDGLNHYTYTLYY